MNVLLAGHDWGGLNLLVPLMRRWTVGSSISWDFVGAPLVRREMMDLVPEVRFSQDVEKLTDWVMHDPPSLEKYLTHALESRRYDLIICGTSAHALLERGLLAAGRLLGIPTIAFCDMAWAFEERFSGGGSWFLPDRLWVTDDAMAQSAGKVKWPSPLKIDVVGSPLFDELLARRGASSHRRCSIRFISEPASTKFPEARIDEFAIAEMVVSAARTVLPDSPVIIRPHPTDSVESWRRWCYARRAAKVQFDTLPLAEALDETLFAVGISSMLLTQMRLAGADVASIQPSDADRSYYVLPFDEFRIERIANLTQLEAWFGRAEVEHVPAAGLAHKGAIDRVTQLVLQYGRS